MIKYVFIILGGKRKFIFKNVPLVLRDSVQKANESFRKFKVFIIESEKKKPTFLPVY